LVQSEDFRERPEFRRAAQREGVFTPAAEGRGGGAAGWRRGGVRKGGPPPPRPPCGDVGGVWPGGRVRGGFRGGVPPRPRPPGGGVGGRPGGRAASPPAAGRWGGGGPGGRAAFPPAAGWRVRGVRGHWPPLPLEYQAAPQSSILRTGNKDFSLWKSSRFHRPGGTFSLSSGLCISGTAALRTNLSSANGVSGKAWANVCKLLNELGRVVVWRFHENSSVGHVRACASIYSGLSELARVLPSPFI